MAKIDATGATPTDLAGWRADLQGRFRTAFGSSLTFDPATPQAQLAGVNALGAAETDEAIVALGANIDIRTAVGVWLDAAFAPYSISRIQTDFTTIKITLSGTARTAVPAGARIESSGGDVFVMDGVSPAVLGADGTLADVPFTAREAGPVAVLPNDDWTIVSVTAGWTGAANPLASTPGRDAETDEAYRLRGLRRMRASAPYLLDAIVAALLAVPGVEKARVYENATDTAATVANVAAVTPHSIMAMAYTSLMGNQTALGDAIAKAIEDAKAPGVRTFGSSSRTIDGRVIRFYSNNGTSIKIAITMTYRLGVFPSDGEARIKKALVDHAAAHFQIGEKIDVPRLEGSALVVPGWTWSAFDLQDEHGVALNVASEVAGNNVYTLSESDISITASIAT